MARKKQMPTEVYLVVSNVDKPNSAHVVEYASWSRHYCLRYAKRAGGGLGVIGPYVAAPSGGNDR